MTDAVQITGVDVICARLHASDDLVAVVPAAKIKGGALPENIVLPAILVLLVSSSERPTLAQEADYRFIDRVEVKVRATSYRQQRQIIALVRSAGAFDHLDEIAGAQRVSSLKAGRGPDLRGPGNSFDQSFDFRVSGDVRA